MSKAVYYRDFIVIDEQNDDEGNCDIYCQCGCHFSSGKGHSAWVEDLCQIHSDFSDYSDEEIKKIRRRIEDKLRKGSKDLILSLSHFFCTDTSTRVHCFNR